MLGVSNITSPLCCTHMYAFMRVHVWYVCICKCNVYIYVYTCVCVCMCVSMCVCVCIILSQIVIQVLAVYQK